MSDRDELGRFTTGNPGNPNSKGRPKKAIEETYYKVTTHSVSFEDWKVIIARAVEQAKKGNKDARKFLAEYLMGAPEQYLNINQEAIIEFSWGDEEADESNQGLSQETTS